MRIRKTENPGIDAEGTLKGVPYNSELASADGSHFHFWLGDTPDYVRAKKLAEDMMWHRDVVSVSYSEGQPTKYWAHENYE